MATLCGLLPCYSIKLFSNNKHSYSLSNSNTTFHSSPTKHFRTCASSVKKFRSNRKVKSNVELCTEIREFVLAMGFPEGHVPSFKELSDRGRIDLANIVRRRGYKVIRDLLSSPINVDDDMSNEKEQLLIKKQDAIAGQDEELTAILTDTSMSTEFAVNVHDHPSSTDADSVHNIGDDNQTTKEKQTDMPVDCSLSTEVPVNGVHLGDAYVEHRYGDDKQADEKLAATLVDVSLSPATPMTEAHPGSVDAVLQCYSSDNGLVDEKEEPLSYEEREDGETKTMVERSSFSTTTTTSNSEQECEEMIGLTSGESSLVSMESLGNSLEEKVAKFIQNGHLDAIEDYIGVNKSVNAVEALEAAPSDPKHGHMASGSSAALAFNGSLSSSTQVKAPAAVKHKLGNANSSTDAVAGTCLTGDPDTTTPQMENQVEINRLKFKLHKKEVELSKLKDQIEREQRALSAFQSKAGKEITKAQKLISEKEVELLAAEESLSGLVEVVVQYDGEGEIVEVAGSFNGWHHRIKLDPQPSSTIIDSTRSRKPRLWSTTLWLYPGVYEIKFIVDGHWRIDPHVETVHKGGITNNILRVQ